jgi:hypothetical protein
MNAVRKGKRKADSCVMLDMGMAVFQERHEPACKQFRLKALEDIRILCLKLIK